MRIVLNESNKKKSVFDEAIKNSKIDLTKFQKDLFQSMNDSIRFFENLPFGKELKKSFGKMSLRFPTNDKPTFDLVYLQSFMQNFYKTLLISIDKKAKQSKDFGFNDVKTAIYNKENQKELKKALNIFNCKYQNHYLEFSKNGFIELYTQQEYLRLKKVLKLKEIEIEKQKPKTTSLKNDSESIKIYREIISRALRGKIIGKTFSEGREDITEAHIIDVADEIKEDSEKLKNRFYKWIGRNQDRFNIILYEEIEKVKSNQLS